MSVTDIKTRILHISDLHFGSNRFSISEWISLCNYVKRFKPKPGIIIVTGDLVDSALQIKALDTAKKKLVELSKNCDGAEVVVIPGNHDIGLYGNLTLPRSLRLFNAVFETCILDRKRIKEILIEKEILIVPFNSCDALFLASGEISANEIRKIPLYVNDFVKYEKSAASMRIAILHHHPLPIPYVNKKETKLEPFLILRNAGTFIAELTKFGHHFDLILHGHKHYPNFSKINIGINNDKIAVMACGSSCLTNPEHGRNSLNLIDLYKNGRVMVEQYEFGGSKTMELSSKKPLFDIIDLKRRFAIRNFQRQGFKFKKIEKEIKIKSYFGNSIINQRFLGLDLLGGRVKKGRPFNVYVDKGRILYAKISKESEEKGFELKVLNQDNGLIDNQIKHELNGQVDFGQILSGVSPRICYTVEYKTQSAYSMTAQEYRRTVGYSSNPFESTMYTVCCPADELSINLTFDQHDILMKLTPNLRVWVCKDFELPQLDEDGEFMHDPESDNFVIDPEMTSFEKPNLIVQRNKWSLVIKKPVVGYRYEIYWYLPTERSLTEFGFPNISGEVDAYQNLLIKHRERVKRNENDPRTNKIRSIIKNITISLREYFGSFEDEIFSLTLMTYDKNIKKMVIVDGFKAQYRDGQTEQLDLSWDFKIDPYLGNAGLAYKRGSRIRYHEAYDKYKNRFIICPSSNTWYPTMISFPIFHPDVQDLEKDFFEDVVEKPVVYVITIASTSSASGLNELLIDKEDPEDLYNTIWKDLMFFSRPILELLKSGDTSQ